MSSIGSGTGIANGFAAAGQVAAQTARGQDRARSAEQRVARDTVDTFEENLESTSQADDPDAELPDHQAPGYEQLYLQDGDGQALATPSPSADDTLAEEASDPAASTPPPGSPGHPGNPLYQHLDVKA